jgi:hypothetical protein
MTAREGWPPSTQNPDRFLSPIEGDSNSEFLPSGSLTGESACEKLREATPAGDAR